MVIRVIYAVGSVLTGLLTLFAAIGVAADYPPDRYADRAAVLLSVGIILSLLFGIAGELHNDEAEIRSGERVLRRQCRVCGASADEDRDGGLRS